MGRFQSAAGFRTDLFSGPTFFGPQSRWIAVALAHSQAWPRVIAGSLHDVAVPRRRAGESVAVSPVGRRGLQGIHTHHAHGHDASGASRTPTPPPPAPRGTVRRIFCRTPSPAFHASMTSPGPSVPRPSSIYWGGHPGTTGQRFRFNGQGWIVVPELATTPKGRSECYMQQWNVVVDVPVRRPAPTGENVVEGDRRQADMLQLRLGPVGLVHGHRPGLLRPVRRRPHPQGAIQWRRQRVPRWARTRP